MQLHATTVTKLFAKATVCFLLCIACSQLCCHRMMASTQWHTTVFKFTTQGSFIGGPPAQLVGVWQQVCSTSIQLAQIYRVSIQEEEDGDKFLTVKVPAVQQQQERWNVAYLPLHLHTMLQVETIEQNYNSRRRECRTVFYSASRRNNSHHFLTRFWPNDESKMHSPITR